MSLTMPTANELHNMHKAQMECWEMARLNYQVLDSTEVRNVMCNGVEVRLQHNPARITSVTSRPQQAAKEKGCFLCNEQLPAEQLRLAYDESYHLLVNPYPIFKQHFTIPTLLHTPQRIATRMSDMLHMARTFAPYTIFYNGPACGASAPMHMHFQAVEAGIMPIEQQYRTATRTVIGHRNSAQLALLSGLLRHVFVIEARELTDAVSLFDTLYNAMSSQPDNEPMMNIIARYETELQAWVILIFPRSAHRPACYHAQDASHRLISPASVEMGGLIITPRHEDFEQLTAEEITTIYNEVSPSQSTINNITTQLQLLLQ